MKVTLDVENTVTERDGKMHLDPFEPNNSLTMVGILTDQDVEMHFTFDHKEATGKDYSERVQWFLDQATVLIGHNIAYDLVWLWESGFKYDGPVFDTMLAEYVLQRGIKLPLSLEQCAERYNLETKKQGTLKEYFKAGYSTRDIPIDELKKYLSADLHATQQLANKINVKLNSIENSGLINTVNLTNELSVCLAKIYQRGMSVDLTALNDVRKEFEKEKNNLVSSLDVHVKKLMGDTPINLNSPEQLSWVIYGRKVIDKTEWVSRIDPYMEEQDFRTAINIGTEQLYKTKAKQCFTCSGTGYVHKTKKDGTPYLKKNRCASCDTQGYLFEPTNVKAGLRFKPPTPKWTSANGFSTSKSNLSLLITAAKNKNMHDAVDFLSKVVRLSALDTYLSSFVEGIETYTKKDGKLHVNLMQHRTSTGRLSGSNPNMQNMPRGGTFSVKKVFVSRFDGGKILEADFAQLEFRTAAFLSQDGVAIEEVKTGFDVHSYTAKVITEAGQPTTRQDAKAHTFAPLYGATGYGRTQAEAKYYEHFNEKYKEVSLWHSRLAKEALETQKIKTPSGREFLFPDVVRRANGSVSHFTTIKNYPVQSFATADIVPIVILHIEKYLKDMRSCIVNSVHDSLVIDVHPEEEKQVFYIINQTNKELISVINLRWGIDFNVPLLLEAKIGKNWLDTKDVS